MSGGRQSGPAMRGPRGIKGGPKAKNPIQTLKRILGIVLKGYPVHCVFVVIGIVVSVLANVRGSLFLRTLIDDYITPMMGQGHRRKNSSISLVTTLPFFLAATKAG